MAASSPNLPFPVSPLPPSGLVGRERELQRLNALLTAAASGRGQLALIGGAAGIGKTALVRAITAAAEENDYAVLSGGCYDLSVTPPYCPWYGLLTSVPRGDTIYALPAAFSDIGNPGLTGEEDLIRQVIDILVTASATRPVVAVLEDLHWADHASLELLRHLAHQVANLPMLLVATYRADELNRRHPLAQLLPTLVREAPTERFDLRPLDDTALMALIAERYPLPEEAASHLVAYVQHAAEGNPFYAHELLRNLEEERVLRPGSLHWTLDNLERVRLPALLQQVVEGRLTRLGEAARDHLAIAAVIGQQIPLAVWQKVGGLSVDEILQTVELAVEAHVLEAGNDGDEVEFAHALVREVLYESILPPRRRIWHRQVAEVVAELPGPDPDAVAYHFAQAGDARAADWLVKAGERAFRLYAWLTARDRYSAAVTLLEGDASQADRRGWLLYRLGRLLRLNDPGHGVANLEEAERVGRAIGDPLLTASALVDRGVLLCMMNETAQGLAALRAGVAALEALPANDALPDPSSWEWIADAVPATPAPTSISADHLKAPLATRRGALALWLAHSGHFAEARTMGESLAAQLAGITHHDALSLSATGDAEFAVGVSEAALGRPALARAALRRSQAALQMIDHHYQIWAMIGFELSEVMLPYYTTDTTTRRMLVAVGASEMERAGGALEYGRNAQVWDLDVLVLEGKWSEAEQRARTSIGTAHRFRRLSAVIGLAVLARWRGETEEAWCHVEDALPSGSATEAGSYPFRQAMAVQRLAIDLALDAGDLPAASAWLASHDAWLAWSGAVRGQADGRRLWARYHRVAGDLSRTLEQATESVALATAPNQPLVLLEGHRLLGEIATEMTNWDEAESHLRASLAMADACAAPFERALTLAALADLRAATGETAEANLLLAEVRAIVEPLGAAPLLARVNALEAQLATRPVPIDSGTRLSAREIEVLRLVAVGRSNPGIAADLFISPRTVTTHLTHIFAKLGVEGRAEAVALAVRQGLI
jgi:DNA-binding CsgD family transcriptional regulator